MSRFENLTTGAIFSVDDSKDHRYAGEGYKRLGGSPSPAPVPNPEPSANPEPNPAPAAEEPPRGGEGSGREAWAAYATAIGAAFNEDASREDVIAAVDAHKAQANQP